MVESVFVTRPRWNLCRRSKNGKLRNLCPREAEFSGSECGWRLGCQNYAFLADDRVAAFFRDNEGSTRLAVISSDGKVEEYGQMTGELPRSSGGPAASPDGRSLYFLGGGPAAAVGIYRWREAAPGAAAEPAEELASSVKDDMRLDPAYVSEPSLLKYETAGGEVAYAYYYPPTSPRYEAPEGTAPQLLVKAHGGPTGSASVMLNPLVQFWTSRGFALLDVDYRGSTGYGREYRERLAGCWGVADVDDVCAGAEYLVKRGLADPKRLAIDGGSAGGYTTLAALTFRSVFTAGCSLYGVADLAALAADTHKFESRYLDGLVGRYPEDKAVYEERSPICHTDRLALPILLLQGAEDKIVPPNRARGPGASPAR